MSPVLQAFTSKYGLAALVAVTGMCLFFSTSWMPTSVRDLLSISPYLLLVTSVLMAVFSNNSRLIVLAVLLIATYYVFDNFLGVPIDDSQWRYRYYLVDDTLWRYRFSLETGALNLVHEYMLIGIAVFVPLNILILSLFKDKKFFTLQSIVHVLSMVVQVSLLYVAVKYNWVSAQQMIFANWDLLDSVGVSLPPVIVVFSGICVVLTYLVSINHSEANIFFFIQLFMFAGLVAIGASHGFQIAILCLSAMLMIRLFQIFNRLAFNDELTGLSSRRAFNEMLKGLGNEYVIAMMDIDHFKSFNDTYGHDVGDQVLKMVAGQLRTIRGGGRPFRYGGEEFAVVFPRKKLQDTVVHLEKMREKIANYPFVLRQQTRPKNDEEGEIHRNDTEVGQTVVHVTISIGVAERDSLKNTAQLVMKEADEALYRAKEAGRDNVQLQREVQNLEES